MDECSKALVDFLMQFCFWYSAMKRSLILSEEDKRFFAWEKCFWNLLLRSSWFLSRNPKEQDEVAMISVKSRGPKFDMKKTRNKKKKKKVDMFFRETCAAGRLTRSLACCTRCTTLRRAIIAAVSAALAIWKSLQLLQFFPYSMIMQSKLHHRSTSSL